MNVFTFMVSLMTFVFNDVTHDRLISHVEMLLIEMQSLISMHQIDDDSLTDVSELVESTNNEDHPTMVEILLTYANSFNFDGTICTVQDLKDQFDSIRSNKRKSSISSVRKIDDDNSDENTTVTDGSKFQWENLSDSQIHQTKSPIIVREVLKDRPCPTLIIIREILTKPSTPIRTCQPLSTKPPIVPKRRRDSHVRIPKNKPSKKTLIETDSIDRDIKQRKEKQRVNPYHYVQRYGTSLYAQEIFRNLLTTNVL